MIPGVHGQRGCRSRGSSLACAGLLMISLTLPAQAQQTSGPAAATVLPTPAVSVAGIATSPAPFISNTAAPQGNGQSITTATASTPGVSSGTFLQAFFGLVFLLVLLLGLAWVARKLQGGKGFGEGGMRLLGGIALGPRERMVLVEVGEDLLVIGIVPGQIRTLHRLAKSALPQPGASSASKLLGGSGHGLEKTFADWLGQFTHKAGSPERNAQQTSENKDNHGKASD